MLHKEHSVITRGETNPFSLREWGGGGGGYNCLGIFHIYNIGIL